jgi:hypothetical protein
MAAFDPDAWLAKKQEAPSPFDPDAWLSKRSGVEPSAPKAPEPRPEDQSFLRQVADIPLKVGAGAVTGVRMIADTFGAENPVSKNLRGVEDWVGELYSAQSKKDSKEIARIMKEAEDKGILDQVVAGVKAMAVAPVDTVANALGTSAPAILAGLATVLTGGGTLAGAALAGGVGAAMGAGTIKSAIYDATKEVLAEKTKLTPEQIEAAAIKAQEYKGDNLDQILLGMGLGAVGARTGAEPVIARSLARDIVGRASKAEGADVTKKAAMQAAIKESTEKGTKTAAERGVIKHGSITAGKEFLSEGAEGSQEQIAQNLALQRQGFDVPTFRGAVSQGVMEGLAGAGMGGAGGVREAYKAKQEVAGLTGEDKDKVVGNVLTTAGMDKRAAAPQPTQEQLDLMETATAIGTDTAAPPTPPTDTTVEARGKALAYIDGLDADPTKKPNASTLRSLVKQLGLDVPSGGKGPDGFNTRAVQALRTYFGYAPSGVGAPSGTDNAPSGTSAGVDESANPPTDVAGTPGNPPGDMGGTGAATPPGAVGTKVEFGALSPETQTEISNRRDDLFDLIEKGVPAKQIKSKLNFLNKLETTHGVEPTTMPTPGSTPDGLPARRIKMQQLINEGRQAAVVGGPEGATVPAQKGTDVEAAMKLADKYEKEEAAREEKQRVKGLEESGKKSLPNITVDPAIIEEYKATRDEIEANANAHAQQRVEMADNLESLYKERETAEAKLDKDELNDPSNEALLQKLDEEIQVAEKALQEHGVEKARLPDWDKKMSPEEKEVYLENIRKNTIEEHRAAAQALIRYRQEQGIQSREGEGTTNRDERRLIKLYEDNRKATGEKYGFKFPAWRQLSKRAKIAWMRTLASDTSIKDLLKGDLTINKALTIYQQDEAFGATAQQIIKETDELSAGEQKAQQERVQKIQAQVRAESEKAQARYQKLRDDQRRAAGSMPAADRLPNALVKKVKNGIDKDGSKKGGSLKTFLTDLAAFIEDSKVPHKKIYNQLANLIRGVNLKTEIVYVDSLPDDDLAIYSPEKDVIYVTSEGMTYTTILHELVHAASVRVLNLYYTGKKDQLTKYQIAAIEQIEAIYKTTQPALASRHPNAYEKTASGANNYYEFLAYALTDKFLQVDLHEESAEYTQDIAFGLRKDKIPERPSAWTVFVQAIARIVGYKPGQMKSKNFLVELNAAFEDILSAPTESIYLTDLAAKQAPKQLGRSGGMDDPDLRKQYGLSEQEDPESKVAKAVKDLFKIQGWRSKGTKYVDSTYEAGARQRLADLGGKIIRDMSKAFNNFYDHMTLATGEKLQFITHYLDSPLTDLKQSFKDWIELTGKKFEDAMIDFHMYAEMFHEPERRAALFVQSVPLSTKKVLKDKNGKLISPADRRTQILGDPSKGIAGLVQKVELTETQQKQLWAELTSLADNYKDGMDGYSPRADVIGTAKNKDQADLLEDKYGEKYNALGINKDEVDLRKSQFDALPQEERNAIMAVFDGAKALSEATKELNKIGNYLSFPASNLIGMFDYQFYMPFKGKGKKLGELTEKDQWVDPEGIGGGKALQEIEHVTHGRFGVANHPLQQLMSDAYRGADRAGRRNYTQAIKNALPSEKKNPDGTGIILGKVVDHIPFEERSNANLEKYKGGANIFHYNADGSIDILQVSEPEILNALRYSFKQDKPLLDLANDVTGWIGAQHTRYNFNFAPKNFVTDMFTNAWNMGGGMMGPLSAPKYIGVVAARVLQNGLGKAWDIALLNEKGDPKSQQRMNDSAKKDPFVRDMLEMIQFGGKTAYIESFSIKNNTEKLRALKSKNWVIRGKEGLDAFLDTWSGMFELTSRTAAYSMFKEFYYNQEKAKGTSDVKGPNGEMSEAEIAAATQAAAETKNLTNFEKVGLYGRELGAAYMFIRPSAISATRAIETVAPAFTPLSWAKQRMPKVVMDDPAAEKEFIKNYETLQRNSRIMVMSLTGMGTAMYYMAMMMAPDDDWERNSVKTDNMEQWTRNARFHIPDSVGLGRDVVIQLPWGFGLGAFPAIGAQIGGMFSGQTTIKQGMGNIVGSILTDSFLPIPISKIPMTEHPLSWAFDSIMPSVVRPISEYLMNMNGIGQSINSASMRRFGDAFTGGDRIPEAYKDFAQWLYEKSEGKYDMSPNTAYFLTNSYIDGIAKLGELGYNWVDLSKGDKAFNPKTDLVLLGSFFGSKPNVDAREFSKVQDKLKDLETRSKTLSKVNREVYADFKAENPGVETAISVYNQQKARLDKLHKRANELRSDRNIPRIDREEMVRLNIIQQNMLKHSIIERMKGYGIEP